MIYKDKSNSRVELAKTKLGLSGDVYIYNGHFIESLESHKNLVKDSTATSIEEAYQERIRWEIAEKERKESLANENIEEENEDVSSEE